MRKLIETELKFQKQNYANIDIKYTRFLGD
jgi:hypothetical protein